jgi:peptidoglycan biosynthesis protein MviN/MurJ (putative lipid II flippase)
MGSISRSASIVAVSSIGAQLVGFLRTAIIAASLGASNIVDSYYLSLVIPTFISTVITSWLHVNFVGEYTRLLAAGDRRIAAVYRTRMILLVFIVLAALTIIFETCPHIIAARLFGGDQTKISIEALQIGAMTIVPIVMAEFAGVILNCHGRFATAAIAPVINASMSVAAIWFWRDVTLMSLIITLLMGGCAQFMFCIADIRRLELRFEIGRGESIEQLKGAVVKGLAVVPAVILANATAAGVQINAAQLHDGAVAILGYAQRLNGALGQVVVVAVSTVILPYAGSLLARGEDESILALTRTILKFAVCMSLYFLGGIYLFGDMAVKAILQRGSFGLQNATQVADTWLILTLSLLPYSVGTFVAKIGQASRSSIMVLISSFVLFCVTWVVSKWGAASESLPVVAFAFCVGYMATSVIWVGWMIIKFGDRTIVRELFASCVYCLPILCVAALVDLVFAPVATIAPIFMAVLLRGTLYTAVFVGGLELMGVREWIRRGVRSRAVPVRYKSSP